MLLKLVIKNVALIDSAEILFTDGLNVLSGETGSGKSVIIESLNFVLGAKADKTLIRSGENECLVKAEFDVSNNDKIKEIFQELDIDEDDTLIVSRKFNLDGKSSIKINGSTVTVSMLKKFTAQLVDVHGQSEHFNLLKTSNQLDLIDKFGANEILDKKNILSKLFFEYKSLLKELDALGGDESQRQIRLDILNYQINEIESADIKENEEAELLTIKQKLSHQEKIINALSSIKNSINSEGGISDILGNTAKIMSSTTTFSNEYLELYERIESVYSEIDDISETASNLLDDFDVSEFNADEIESRLEKIKTLKNKYGADYFQIQDFLINAKNERERLENFNDTANKLLSKKLTLQENLYQEYNNLSALRRKYSNEFSSNVLSELKELGMKNSSFEVSFNDIVSKDECEYNSANGFDKIEFTFSANKGEPLKPLSMIISGGEMSRFMLSIKSQTAKYNDISTFIFDEIDAGISGGVAKIVAQKFANISNNVQIIAITHLPQISAMADNNLLIEKVEKENKTLTSVKTLSESEKINEIVRLVGGSLDSETAINHAKELIQEANNYKKIN